MCVGVCVCFSVLRWRKGGQAMDDLKVQRLESSTQGQTQWHEYPSKQEKEREREGPCKVRHKKREGPNQRQAYAKEVNKQY